MINVGPNGLPDGVTPCELTKGKMDGPMAMKAPPRPDIVDAFLFARTPSTVGAIIVKASGQMELRGLVARSLNLHS